MALNPLPERPTPQQVMQDAPVIPVIVLQDVAHAVPLSRALVAGGIRMLEITLRTPVALACIEAIAKEVPEAVVGAGTVRSASDAQAATMAGARFVVSPGYTQAVGKACHGRGGACGSIAMAHSPARRSGKQCRQGISAWRVPPARTGRGRTSSRARRPRCRRCRRTGRRRRARSSA